LADTKPITGEIGVAGVSLVGGYVVDPIARFRHLSGQRLRWEYERVAETDPGVAACETAVALVCRSVKWRLDPSKARPDGDAQAQAEAEFVTGCLLDDMSHAFGDAVSDALTMTKHGFSFLEVVYKRRLGPDQTDPAKRSRFTDGRIGIRKLAGRDAAHLEPLGRGRHGRRAGVRPARPEQRRRDRDPDRAWVAVPHQPRAWQPRG
jgi:hypothetical protein